MILDGGSSLLNVKGLWNTVSACGSAESPLSQVK
jgi:hypothetical protein